jgi:hypothetical protein
MTLTERVADIRARIVTNPWPAVGIAVAAGAIVASLGGGRRERGRIAEAAFAAVGAFVVRLARDAALKELASYALRRFSEFTADREAEVR